MNHPKYEEWVPYLFGEAKSQARQQLRKHLQSCPECRAEIAAWKRSLKRLDAWRLPKSRRPITRSVPLLTWGFATCALLLLSAVFMLGRLTSNAAMETRLRSTLSAQMRQQLDSNLRHLLGDQLAQSVSATLAASADQTKALLIQYDQTVSARFQTERTERISACLSLKKDVDTIAINADAGLRDTEHRLAQLADFRQPALSPNLPLNNSTHH